MPLITLLFPLDPSWLGFYLRNVVIKCFTLFHQQTGMLLATTSGLSSKHRLTTRCSTRCPAAVLPQAAVPPRSGTVQEGKPRAQLAQRLREWDLLTALCHNKRWHVLCRDSNLNTSTMNPGHSTDWFIFLMKYFTFYHKPSFCPRWLSLCHLNYQGFFYSCVTSYCLKNLI